MTNPLALLLTGQYTFRKCMSKQHKAALTENFHIIAINLSIVLCCALWKHFYCSTYQTQPTEALYCFPTLKESVYLERKDLPNQQQCSNPPHTATSQGQSCETRTATISSYSAHYYKGLWLSQSMCIHGQTASNCHVLCNNVRGRVSVKHKIKNGKLWLLIFNI